MVKICSSINKLVCVYYNIEYNNVITNNKKHGVKFKYNIVLLFILSCAKSYLLNTFLPAVPKLKYLSSRAPSDIKYTVPTPIRACDTPIRGIAATKLDCFFLFFSTSRANFRGLFVRPENALTPRTRDGPGLVIVIVP